MFLLFVFFPFLLFGFFPFLIFGFSPFLVFGFIPFLVFGFVFGLELVLLKAHVLNLHNILVFPVGGLLLRI